MSRLTISPVIGITTFGQNEQSHYHLASTYVEAVRLAGGLPVLLPPDEPLPTAILEFIDGLIFSGGGDLDPATYNSASHPAISVVDHKRDTFELNLAKAALKTDIPLLGICRGIGLLNVASGGTLLPHVPDVFGEIVAHTGKDNHPVEHLVQIESDTLLAKVIGLTETSVVSLHHQAVHEIAAEWRISAYASDGVIEALEHKYHPWAIALQWHPEMTIHAPCQERIFQALVAAACARKMKNSLATAEYLTKVC